MRIGDCVTRLLMTCAEIVKKWAVLPLSGMAVVSRCWLRGVAGGPI
jgi:hypothetical protein